MKELSLLTKQGFFNEVKKMFKNLSPDELELSNQKLVYVHKSLILLKKI